MTPGEVVGAQLEDEELARIDALARARGISLDEMILNLVRTGIVACEQADAPPVSHRRLKGPAS